MNVRSDNIHELPRDLPVPQDDGACDHLTEMRLPRIVLASTRGRAVDLAGLGGTTVIYIYPRTGRPDQEVPTGWNEIPGARGCTPQSCAFRDHFEELKRAGAAQVFGLSTRTPPTSARRWSGCTCPSNYCRMRSWILRGR